LPNFWEFKTDEILSTDNNNILTKEGIVYNVIDLKSKHIYKNLTYKSDTIPYLLINEKLILNIKNDQLYICNFNGEFISKKPYSDFIFKNSNYLIAIGIDGVSDIFDNKFNLIGKINNEFEPNTSVNDDRIGVLNSKTGKYGFCDLSGKLIIKCIFEEIHPFSEGVAFVKSIDEFGKPKRALIDKIGDFLIHPKYSFEPNDFHDGLATVKNTKNQYAYRDNYQ